ncbi:MAG: hypothetical protein ACRDZO_18450 [Egibacteraceae bacterium]
MLAGGSFVDDHGSGPTLQQAGGELGGAGEQVQAGGVLGDQDP